MMLPTPLISKDMKGKPGSPNCPPIHGVFSTIPAKKIISTTALNEKWKNIFNSSARRIKGRLTSHPPEAEAQNQGLHAAAPLGLLLRSPLRIPPLLLEEMWCQPQNQPLKFWNFPDVFLKANMRKKKTPALSGDFRFSSQINVTSPFKKPCFSLFTNNRLLHWELSWLTSDTPAAVV